MRYILALIPPKETMSAYIQAAQMLFSPIQEGYLLSENSLPHITICQFECNDEQEILVIWQQIEKLNILPITPRFTGVSFIKGIGVHGDYYWAELSVARDQEMIKIHLLMQEVLKSHRFDCINDSNDLYRPHLTLARIMLPDIIQKWPSTLLDRVEDFRVALAKGDDNGQYLCTIFKSNSL